MILTAVTPLLALLLQLPATQGTPQAPIVQRIASIPLYADRLIE